MQAWRPGTLRYSPDGEWQAGKYTNDSYFRIACQTSPSFLSSDDDVNNNSINSDGGDDDVVNNELEN